MITINVLIAAGELLVGVGYARGTGGKSHWLWTVLSLFKLFSTAASPNSSAMSLNQLLCCLPKIETPANLSYDNVFRIIIMQFLDAYNFDVRSVKKTCVHIVHPDGRIIPFDTFNMFYRDDKETRLKQLQGDVEKLVQVGIGGK